MRSVIPVLLACLPLSAAPGQLPLVFRCSPENDLYRVLSARGDGYPRYGSAAEAVARAPQGAGVLILADEYPAAPTPLDEAVFQAAAKKRLRLYVEYPSRIPGMTLGAARDIEWERAVIASNAFTPALEKLRILGIHRARFLPTDATDSDIVVARVAGLDTAIYGLPQKEVSGILFRLPEQSVMVATTKLSQFVAARFAPAEAWGPIWKHILEWLCPGRDVPELHWTPSVHPSFSAHEVLPSPAGRDAFRRGAAAFAKAHLFVHPSWKAVVLERAKVNDSVGARPDPSWLQGDGREGLLEGFSSSILQDGSQSIRWNLRNDCIGEASLTMALWSVLDHRPDAGRIAANLNDYIYTYSPLAQGTRADPNSASYGLVGWSYPGHEGVYYGDDNARSMLGTMGAAAVLKTDRWDKPLLRCLLANLRTTGKQGFRGYRLDEAPLQKNGWRHYYNSDRVHYAPHYEAYPWACFLWAFHKTGYQPFLDRAVNAIRMTLLAYPAEWRWTNGIQQERARMLLPLAWLVRVQDTAEHRRWLRDMAQELLASQDASGAIREELGVAGKGSYGPARSNEDYGKHEATLIQSNGDPVCDLLYTTNFAFLGLHEAAAATGDPAYRQASDRLAKFLTRIQVRSRTRPELDGWWFRAFDYKRWDYWASNADAGWGVWSTESGWTQSWITSVLGMRLANTSLWDLTAGSRIGERLEGLLPEMLAGISPALPNKAGALVVELPVRDQKLHRN